jgi:predicted aspartyl protease
MVPVVLNNTLTLKFQIDSGSSDVSVSRGVVSMLMRSGTLDRSDFLGKQMYTLADGSTVSNETFRLHALRVGDREMRDVTCSVGSEDGGLLLGQSFLQRFKSWSIDNRRRMLVLN